MFQVKGQTSTKDGGAEKRHFALKRLFVNNDRDLAICKREIAIVVSYSEMFLHGSATDHRAMVPCHSQMFYYMLCRRRRMKQ